MATAKIMNTTSTKVLDTALILSIKCVYAEKEKRKMGDGQPFTGLSLLERILHSVLNPIL